jgi:predicted permease
VPGIFFQTALIISSMPTAVNTFILAGGMGLDERYACEIVAVSTCLAPISIPVWIALLGIG